MQRFAKPWTSVRFRAQPPNQIHYAFARVAELVDARDLKSLALTGVPVRFRPRAPSVIFQIFFYLKLIKVSKTIVSFIVKPVHISDKIPLEFLHITGVI